MFVLSRAIALCALQFFNLTQRFARAHIAQQPVVKLQIAEEHCSELYLWPVQGITQDRSRLVAGRRGADSAFRRETASRVSPKKLLAIVFEARDRISYNMKFVH